MNILDNTRGLESENQSTKNKAQEIATQHFSDAPAPQARNKVARGEREVYKP